MKSQAALSCGDNREPRLVLKHYQVPWSALMGGSLEKRPLARPLQLGLAAGPESSPPAACLVALTRLPTASPLCLSEPAAVGQPFPEGGR